MNKLKRVIDDISETLGDKEQIVAERNKKDFSQSRYQKLVEEIKKLKPIKLDKLKVEVLNQPEFPSEIKVSNFPKPPKYPEPVKEVSVKEPKWYAKMAPAIYTPIVKSIYALADGIINLTGKQFQVKVDGSDPKDPVAVRLSDGEKFYTAISRFISGARSHFPFKSANGHAVPGLTDETGKQHVLDYGYNGTNWHEKRIDTITRADNGIDYAHHELHAGSMYTAEDNAVGASGTKATISFTTPDTMKWFHLVIAARSNVESFFTMGEAVTVTAASGADYVPRNKNRNSANTSGAISAGSAGGANNVTLGGAVTNFGTTLETIHFGNGKLGGEGRGVREWILKQNTTYAFEVESQASNSEVTVEIFWYEHTNKAT